MKDTCPSRPSVEGPPVSPPNALIDCRRRGLCRWVLLLVGVIASAAMLASSLLVPNRPDYRTAPVDRGEVRSLITASGTVVPLVSIKVGSQLSGQIAEVLVDFNSMVRQGQLLARLDPRPFAAEVRESEAELEMATAQVATRAAAVRKAAAAVEKARALRTALEAHTASARADHRQAVIELTRKQNLVERRAVAQSEVDEAEARLDSAHALLDAAEAQVAVQEAEIRDAEAGVEMARAELENARAVVERRRASLERAQVDLARTEITAPLDGIVIQREVDPGQTVAASLQAPTLFTLARDLERMKLEVRVDEADIGRVRVDQPVGFGVDAYPERRFEGVVVQIRKAPEMLQNLVTYTVIASAENPDGALLPGMTAVVRILVEEAHDALRVPNAALRFMPGAVAEPAAPAGETAGGSPPASAHLRERVWILDPEGRPRPVPIRLGISDERFSAVTAGALESGQLLIIDRLSSGSR